MYHHKADLNDLMTSITFLVSSVSAIIEPIPMGVAGRDYLSRYVNSALLTGLTELCKRKPADPFVSILLIQSLSFILHFL